MRRTVGDERRLQVDDSEIGIAGDIGGRGDRVEEVVSTRANSAIDSARRDDIAGGDDSAELCGVKVEGGGLSRREDIIKGEGRNLLGSQESRRRFGSRRWRGGRLSSRRSVSVGSGVGVGTATVTLESGSTAGGSSPLPPRQAPARNSKARALAHSLCMWLSASRTVRQSSDGAGQRPEGGPSLPQLVDLSPGQPQERGKHLIRVLAEGR